MYKPVVSGAAAAFVVFAAPALVIYAASDLDWSKSLAEQWVFSTPVIWSASAFAYIVLLGAAAIEGPPSFVAMAAGLCLCLPMLTLGGAMPFLFGIAETDPGSVVWAVVMAVLSLPAAVVQIVMLRNHRRAFFEFLSYPLSAALGIAIAGQLGLADRSIMGAAFSKSWPMLFVATPFAVLAAVFVGGASWRQLGRALIIVLAPFYLLKGATEWADGLGWRAVYWPVSMWTNYLSPSDRLAARRNAARRIEAGQPICIGQRWYRFKKMTINWNMSAVRNLQCMSAVGFMTTADALGVASAVGGTMTVSISALSQRGPEPRERDRLERERRGASQGPTTLAVEDGDLVVLLLPPYGAHVPDDQAEFVRDRLRQFIRDARLPAPPHQ